ncbi:MAG: hypothetical protein PW789_19285 [Edaphobacter sp.]|uniref:hypothetical protein n=1 Tax=Edaphobacter sp. TaxID=1934404 RepID=UPI00238891AA|nr:hypothetical protein [Edaphobacter sp.]MDE1178724.1 hypothetical protein [Edaphobacter sp.]
MRRLLVALALFVSLLTALPTTARATEVGISAQALERTLKTQLFNTPDGRYYLRGDAKAACYVYAENPHVTFRDDRVVVSIHTKAKLGTSVYGNCVGVGLTRDVEVSVLPDAEGETIGFRDAHIDKLSNSRELNFLLEPFLEHQLPQQMKVNAAELMRQLLSKSNETTGYAITLNNLKIHSMIVEKELLVLDVDTVLSVR